MAVILSAVYLLSRFPFPPEFYERPQNEITRLILFRSKTVWLLFLVVSGFSFAIDLTVELFQQILQKKDIEAEKNKAELALYKAQIDPHFLFNTLNTLYGLIISRSNRLEQVFVKFSSLLQYMYRYTANDTISISQEVSYISHYIDLQSFRYNEHTAIDWTYDIDDPEVRIPPMILITFIENAFKYGSSASKDCRIVIRLSLKERLLSFSSENNMMKIPKKKDPGIGIENCRRRLSLLYPGKFSLETRQESEKFKTCLSIQLP